MLPGAQRKPWRAARRNIGNDGDRYESSEDEWNDVDFGSKFHCSPNRALFGRYLLKIALRNEGVLRCSCKHCRVESQVACEVENCSPTLWPSVCKTHFSLRSLTHLHHEGIGKVIGWTFAMVDLFPGAIGLNVIGFALRLVERRLRYATCNLCGGTL